MRNERKAEKEFVKIVKDTYRNRNLWQVWNDAMTMIAISISNIVDNQYKDVREARYLALAKTYSSVELEGMSKLFSLIVTALDENPAQDFLGKMFMQLNLGNKWKGQFFTPFPVSRLMAEMQMKDAQDQIEQKGWISVCDNCVGAGAMLIAVADAFRDQKINYHDQVLFVGQDIDLMAAMMCYIQLSLIGCPGYIKIGDTLTDPITGYATLFAEDGENIWKTPFYFKDTWHQRRMFALLFDGVSE